MMPPTAIGGFFLFHLQPIAPPDQLRLVSQLRTDYFQIPYDPDPNDYENQQYDSSGLRDSQHELDGFSAFSWVHTFSPTTFLQLSPYYHYNSANYTPSPNDIPIATTSDRTSNYAGVQASLTTQIARNTLQTGFYSFGQHDSYRFGVVSTPGSHPICNELGTADFLNCSGAAGGITEEYVSDNFKATSWLTLIAGLRASQFVSSITEIENDPRFGIAVEIPKINWVFRAFYGRYYQPPPLLTASGPLLDYANSNNTTFLPLRGERDEEHQFGVQIPSADGCWMRTISRLARIIFSTTRMSANRIFSFLLPSTARSSRDGSLPLSRLRYGVSDRGISPIPINSHNKEARSQAD